MSQTLQFLFHTYNTQTLTGLLKTCRARCFIESTEQWELTSRSHLRRVCSQLLRPTFIRTGLIFRQISSGVIYTPFTLIWIGRRLEEGKMLYLWSDLFFFLTLPLLVKTGLQELLDLEELWEYLTAITHRKSANKTCFSCYFCFAFQQRDLQQTWLLLPSLVKCVVRLIRTGLTSSRKPQYILTESRRGKTGESTNSITMCVTAPRQVFSHILIFCITKLILLNALLLSAFLELKDMNVSMFSCSNVLTAWKTQMSKSTCLTVVICWDKCRHDQSVSLVPN